MKNDAAPAALPAFAGYGLEIEYMIVDRLHLDVKPIADRLLYAGAGEAVADVVRGEMGWSNELALHVFEIKNRAPSPTLAPLVDAFHREVRAAAELLAGMDARLMPGGMHPWMEPSTETRLWTQDRAALYACYDRIFDCRRHGWGNLQSVHLNLPFSGDEEFGRLHAAVRLALPILPALAASSPWADKRPSGVLDTRLLMYRDHQRLVPASMGDCIPEPIATAADYHALVLAPMYRQVAEYGAVRCKGDASELRHEWLNARAAVPRFERSAIEIRVLDTQECPLADVAVAAASAGLVRHLYDHRCANADALVDTPVLVDIFERCIRDADQARIEHPDYLALFGLGNGGGLSAGELWGRLLDRLDASGQLPAPLHPPLQLFLQRGPLARRLASALDDDPGRLRAVYGELCECLLDNRLFTGPRVV
ncbi:glutamate-cysteine ligase [Azoarcus olearius]|uniref:carboxylate-amine ligase n=1 Tax=Azoarcus sp. (strain BH72) TaxID=418699 RepID=UPI0008064093|nr:glutamate-cysteine ligase family protein [Azoarcus olearius]ANQ84932.1 glutamate-cysteine ligase [Azoarcus olearius]